MRELRRLEPVHFAAIRLKIEGRSVEEIASELRLSKGTVYKWFSMEIVKVKLAEELERVNEVFAERLATGALIGLDELVDMARAPRADDAISWGQRLDAIRELLDRNPLTTKPSVNGGGPGVQINVGNMSDEQLIARAHELAARTLPPGDVDGDAVEEPEPATTTKS